MRDFLGRLQLKMKAKTIKQIWFEAGIIAPFLGAEQLIWNRSLWHALVMTMVFVFTTGMTWTWLRRA